MKLQKLMSLTRKAVDEFHMIQEGDKIAVGISGGKDSLTMLYALNGLRRFYPQHFTIVDTEIGKIIFEERKEDNPCSLCAKMRKGAFNEKAKELGCNKIAYAHHKDDVVETLLMSLILEGRIHTFSPVTYLDRMDLTLIRPLIYVDEADVKGFMNKYSLPVVKNPCPADGYTQREYAKQLVASLSHEHPGTKERMFTAILNSNLPSWNERTPKKQRTKDL